MSKILRYFATETKNKQVMDNKNYFYILASERDRFDEAFKKFIYELVWCSNSLDGFSLKEVNALIKKLTENRVFQTEIVQALCDKIDEQMVKDN